MSNIATVSLLGGLGNQMFQYAFGYSLEKKYGLTVYYDKSYLEKEKKEYRLSIFAIPEIKLISKDDIIGVQLYRLINRINIPNLQRLFGYHIQNGMQFIIDNPTGVWEQKYIGYWQNERYFKQFQSQIRSQFQLEAPITMNCRKYMQSIIGKKNTVAVHFRRGDYVNHSDVYAKCTNNYYSRAFKYFEDKLNDVNYFIFSDDKDFAKSNWVGPKDRTFYVENNTFDYEDMFLMGKCKHNIIANSTFSWWGAYLGDECDRMVCAPRNFFLHKKTEYPNGWITFDN